MSNYTIIDLNHTIPAAAHGLAKVANPAEAYQASMQEMLTSETTYHIGGSA